jgi:hypothetical protein
MQLGVQPQVALARSTNGLAYERRQCTGVLASDMSGRGTTLETEEAVSARLQIQLGRSGAFDKLRFTDVVAHFLGPPAARGSHGQHRGFVQEVGDEPLQEASDEADNEYALPTYVGPGHQRALT